MNEADAVVVRVEGELAWVKTRFKTPSCAACAGGGCRVARQASLLGVAAEQSQRLLCLVNNIHAVPGDEVLIRAAPGAILRSVWLAYAQPLLLALFAAVVAFQFSDNEALALLGMLAGLGLGVYFLRQGGPTECKANGILSLAHKHR